MPKDSILKLGQNLIFRGKQYLYFVNYLRRLVDHLEQLGPSVVISLATVLFGYFIRWFLFSDELVGRISSQELFSRFFLFKMSIFT